MQIECIHVDNLQSLEAFLASCGSSLETFRYFETRPLSVIQNHLVTLIGFNEEHSPVAYGHLDSEDGKVWLGICVTEHNIGRGYGNLMMEKLLAVAQELELDSIVLTVDAQNPNAARLYEKHGFGLEKETTETCWYRLTL